jgi:tetratricopeptide (TPR) repeat protein
MEVRIVLVHWRFRFAWLAAALALAMPVLQGQNAPPPAKEREDPPHEDIHQPAWKSVEVGDFYLKRKKYRAALSRYQEAVKVDPDYPQAYLGMGRLYDRLGLSQKALENYHKYLDLLPSSKQAEEARHVHEAIARLEGKVGASPSPARNHFSGNSPPSSN